MIKWPVLSDKNKLWMWLVVVAPFTLALFAGTYHYMAFPSCLSCHQQESFVNATAASPHSEVDCASCHIPRGVIGRVEFGAQHLANVVFSRPYGARDLSYVSNSACLGCHEEVVEARLTNNGIRIEHAYCAVETDCAECHSTVAHGAQISWVRTYSMDTCLTCHVAQAAMDCAMCHEGRSREDRITSGTFAVTHGERWEQTHGMGDSTTCVACHTAASCDTCHGVGTPHSPNFVRAHSDYALSPEAQCTDCHQQRFCDDCHGTEMPHTGEFVRTHAQPAQEDERSCNRCHLQADCNLCHDAHVHPGGAIGTLPDEGGGR
ncbi:MAG: hypothetical protein KGZ89_03120 [Actinobacteria bacterium]|nr:hypothetical protein [Actinomycetota bacterium]